VTSKTSRVLLWFGFLVHTFFCLHEIARPFLLGHLGWAAAMRGIIARNYVDLGWIATKLLPYKAAYPLSTPEGPIHWNHPPTINILTGMSFELFGESEWAAHLVTLPFALTSFWLIYWLGRNLFSPTNPQPWSGLAAAWLFALSPLQIEYGKLLNYEVPILALTLGALVAFAQKSQRAITLGVTLMVGAVLVDWAACFLAAALGLSLLLERRWKPFLGLGAATGLTAAGLFVWLNDVGNGGLTKLGARRAAANTFTQLADITADRFLDYFGWPVLVLAALGLVWQVVRPSPNRVHPATVTFGLGTAAYFLVFKNAAFVHVFYILLFLPAVILAATAGLHAIATAVEHLPRAPKHLPVITTAILLVLTGLHHLSSAQELHLRSFSIQASKRGKAPFEARYNEHIVARWLHENSQPDDLIATHTSVNFSLQARYYLHRKIQARVRTLSSPKARFLVFAERRLTRAQRLELDKKHRTIRAVGYFIVDTQNPDQPDLVLEFKARPMTWTYRWLVSRVFPPYELRQKTLAAPSKLK
jgi:hypothetical protein